MNKRISIRTVLRAGLVGGLILALGAVVTIALQANAAGRVWEQEIGRGSRVVMISIDGFRPDFYRKAEYDAPTLKALAAAGTSADGMKPVFPSLTYPNHTSLITGVQTGIHGVLSNSLYDSTKGPSPAWYWEYAKIKAPTLYSAVKAAGKTSASVRWPVTVGAEADVQYLVPEIFPSDGFYEGSMYELTEKLTRPDLFAEIKGLGLTAFQDNTEADVWGAEVAAWLWKNKAPDLLTFHILEVDHQEHDTGPESSETKKAVTFADGLVKKVLDAVDLSSTCVVIVGDHGFLPISQKVNVNTLFVQAGWITLDANGKLQGFKVMAQQSGGQAAIYVKDKTLLPAVEKLLRDNAKMGHFNVIGKKELQFWGAYPDADFAVDGEEGYTIGQGFTGNLVVPDSRKGNHGYRPLSPKLNTGFIAAGCGLPAGKVLPELSVTDVAPTVASLMKVKFRAGKPGKTTPVQSLFGR